ncbi:hypothetical protein HPB52_002883 [Rhipicephalus sanguineus]|uniref:Uncharacterized protein n=1 Tax=Rhipicephalus sanguineus TaxID=34632 RepID=A0A9D4SXE1_RHISA|nr:hypothetical protein HPB52_002883 [Rhipicephalus sanguineus]
MTSVKERKNLDFATKLKAIQRVEAGAESSTHAEHLVEEQGEYQGKGGEAVNVRSLSCARSCPRESKNGEDGDDERIDDAFRESSSLFLAAIPPEVSADDFVEADCNVQAVASFAEKDIVAAVAGTQDAQADSSSGDEDHPDEAA